MKDAWPQGYQTQLLSDLFVQLVGICVAEQAGTATKEMRNELGSIKEEIDRRISFCLACRATLHACDCAATC